MQKKLNMLSSPGGRIAVSLLLIILALVALKFAIPRAEEVTAASVRRQRITDRQSPKAVGPKSCSVRALEARSAETHPLQKAMLLRSGKGQSRDFSEMSLQPLVEQINFQNHPFYFQYGWLLQ
jgi:hypothetical protein